MSIASHYNSLVSKIPKGVKLVAVTKTRTTEEIRQLLDCGHRMMGESKVQELLAKYENLPKDIEWHLVGHLQSNKVRQIAPFISLIHSVDSLKLLKVIHKEGKKNQRIIPCLLQIHIAEEETKYGFSFEEVRELLASPALKSLEYATISGLMGMATFTSDKDQVRDEFRQLQAFYQELKEGYFKDKPGFCELSMGMSDDFEEGIAEGSTMVRVGSAIFGPRR
jgi:PLP dependent protein